MADETNPGAQRGAHEADPAVTGQEAAAETAGGASGEAAPEGVAEEAASDAEELRRELEDMRQHMLRALADAENVRRRAQRDVQDARAYAITSFARDLLSVSDNFNRALQTVEGFDAESLPPELQSLLEGIRMTERELASVFERHGVVKEDPSGQRFDPNRHQAMFEVEDPSVPSGTVVQVVQVGSMIGDRVLRPAMVGVSKGGPKPGEAAAAAGETAGGDDDPSQGTA